MKKIILLILACSALLFWACNSASTDNKQTNVADTTKTQATNVAQQFNVDTTKLKTGDVFYQCEMNPEVLSDTSGSCPKCGMDLVKITKK